MRFSLLASLFAFTEATRAGKWFDRVFIMQDDPQVAKAVDVVPKARDLAMSSRQQTKADQ